MQKHNQWLSNQGYVKHLQILRRIKERRSKQNKNPLTFSPRRKKQKDGDLTMRRRTQLNFARQGNYSNDQRLMSEQTQSVLIPNEHQITHNRSLQDESHRNDTYHRQIRIKDKQFVMSAIPAVMPVSIKQQKILWDNYHLGKRIIQTPPVISKRKLDHEYRKHCKLVRGMTTSCNQRKPAGVQFRLKKLQEYREEVEMIADERRITNTGKKRHILTLRIDQIKMSRVHRLTIEEVVVVVKFEGEKGAQLSQLIGYEQLPFYHFFFSIPRKHIRNRTPIILEIRQVKGLQQKNLGYCTFRFGEEPSIQKLNVNLFHCGRGIGEVTLSAAAGRKKQFIKGEDLKTTQRKQSETKH